MKRTLFFLILLMILVFSIISLASEYPEKPIEMVVPYAPGGRSDIAARILGKYFPKYLGQPMVVTNIAGASGTLGCQEVLEAKPDGYKLVYHHESMISGYETGLVEFTWSDFTVICAAVATDNVIVAPYEAPYNNWQELKDYAQEHPNTLSIGTSVGSTPHLALIVMNNDADGKLDIALGGGGDTDRITKLLGGHLDLTSASVPSIMGFIEAGEVKPILLQSKDKSKFLPDTQTWEEAGLDGDLRIYQVVYGPPGMPDEIVKKISEAVRDISNDPEYVEEIEKNGIEIVYYDTNKAIELLKQEEAYYRPLFKEAGLAK